MDLSATQKIWYEPEDEELVQVGSLRIGSEEYPIKTGITKIGRHSICDIVIKHVSISKPHAEIEARNGPTWIRDLNSLNKTKLTNVIYYLVLSGVLGRKLIPEENIYDKPIPSNSLNITVMKDTSNFFDEWLCNDIATIFLHKMSVINTPTKTRNETMSQYLNMQKSILLLDTQDIRPIHFNSDEFLNKNTDNLLKSPSVICPPYLQKRRKQSRLEFYPIKKKANVAVTEI
ncbi:hypothetical protein PUN28_013903 [Cardiocondyla obscurior]|uniref:FHA domain-containing protein n=1 Tax=Cardiocondyla obscurior TaxID=286306 RepID=A0AAW2F9L7_9HYME